MNSIFRTSLVKIIAIVCCSFILGYVYYETRTIPSNFPVGKHFIVEEGETLRSVSVRLEEEHFIYSALFFRIWISTLGRDRHLQLGEYIFNEKHVLGYMVKKFVSIGPDIPLISVTIPEGSTTYEVSQFMKKALPHFSPDIFGEKVFAKSADGKLFPSTYFLLPSTTEERVVEIMTSTFTKKYKDTFSSETIRSPLKNENDVISLAAILEGEAKTKEDMQVVSGILQKRMTLGIRLQVDAAKETYTIKGLPEQPINNPGLIALYATFHPIESPYLYYITGKDGTMHYAKTFEEHKKNIQKYLR